MNFGSLEKIPYKLCSIWFLVSQKIQSSSTADFLYGSILFLSDKKYNVLNFTENMTDLYSEKIKRYYVDCFPF